MKLNDCIALTWLNAIKSVWNLSVCLAITVVVLVIPGQVFSQQWRPVRGGKSYNISGMAIAKQIDNKSSFLVVHDNKKKSEPRFALVTVEGRLPPLYVPIAWPFDIDLPIDLEALTRIPGQEAQSFMALTSDGTVYHIMLNNIMKRIKILKVLSLPNVLEESNFEGFSVQSINGRLLAVWAHRGKNDQPATVYWGLIDLDTYEITCSGSIELKVPWPVVYNVRHVSDLKVDPNGILVISSTSDPGDDGPFQSAVYIGGVFNVNDNQISFRQATMLIRLYYFDYRKVEAVEFLPDKSYSMVFATDDENMGSSILVDRYYENGW